jgi:hypothetical protein
MTFLTIEFVLALASRETGPIEKIVLAVFVLGVSLPGRALLVTARR